MATTLPKIVYLGCLVLLLATIISVVEAASTPPGIAKNPARASCKLKKYKMCYNLEHVCPKFCPDSCEVECASCKPICSGGSSPPPPVEDGEGEKGGKKGGDDDKGKEEDNEGGKGGKKEGSGGKDKEEGDEGKKNKKEGNGGKDKDKKDDKGGKKEGNGDKEDDEDDEDGKGGKKEGNGDKDKDKDEDDEDDKGGKKDGDGDKDKDDDDKDGDDDDSGSSPPYYPPSPTTPSPSTPTPPSPSPPTTPTPSPKPPTPSTPTPTPPPPSPPTTPTPSPKPPTPSPSTPTPPSPSPPTTPTPSPKPPTPSPPTPTPPSPSPPTTPTPSPKPPTPSSPPNSGVSPRKRVRCYNKNYGQCYNQQHVCPANCPTSCQVDCVTCKPVCSCDYPGAVCQDPRFIGGDGITFYFHGKKNQDFCLVTDRNLHISAHFIGKRNQNSRRDFTWVESIGILFDNHRLFVGAKKTSTWDDANDRLSLAFDGVPISLDETLDSEWRSTSTPQVTITRTTTKTNSIVVEVQGKLKITAQVVPITEQDSRVHNYGITKEDCFAHLDLGFKFFSLTGKVDGVLGKTYREDYVSKVNVGVAMSVMGGEKEYASSSIFATDCLASAFKNDDDHHDEELLMELANMKCASGMNGEAGVVCKR